MMIQENPPNRNQDTNETCTCSNQCIDSPWYEIRGKSMEWSVTYNSCLRKLPFIIDQLQLKLQHMQRSSCRDTDSIKLKSGLYEVDPVPGSHCLSKQETGNEIFNNFNKWLLYLLNSIFYVFFIWQYILNFNTDYSFILKYWEHKTTHYFI